MEIKKDYICKIASLDEMEVKWNYEIQKHSNDSDWPAWREEAFERTRSGKSISYYGILNGEIISEATAIFDPSEIENGEGLADEKTAYLSAFRTNKEYRGRGYFSKLFQFMLEDLRDKGYERVTLGVEPNEVTNMLIYFHYGFTEFVKLGIETFPKGDHVDVLYYAKNL